MCSVLARIRPIRQHLIKHCIIYSREFAAKQNNLTTDTKRPRNREKTTAVSTFSAAEGVSATASRGQTRNRRTLHRVVDLRKQKGSYNWNSKRIQGLFKDSQGPKIPFSRTKIQQTMMVFSCFSPYREDT